MAIADAVLKIPRIWNYFRFFQSPEIADAIERARFRTGSCAIEPARRASELPR